MPKMQYPAGWESAADTRARVNADHAEDAARSIAFAGEYMERMAALSDRVTVVRRFVVVPTPGQFHEKPTHATRKPTVPRATLEREIARLTALLAEREKPARIARIARIAACAKPAPATRVVASDSTPYAEPSAREPKAAGKPKGVRTITADEWARILGAIDCRYPSGIRNRALLMLMHSTGTRVGEVINARPDCIDRERHEFHVPPEGKSGARLATLPRGAEWEALGAALVAWENIREPGAAHYFVTSAGTMLHSNNVERFLTGYAARAGIAKHVTPHMLRHTFASDKLHAGWSLAAVAAQLGHSSPAVTARVYAHCCTIWLHDLQKRDAIGASEQ